MNKKYSLFGLILLMFLISNIFALTQPIMFYPNSMGITINVGTEINWSASIGSGEIVKYNLFYSNNSGVNWYNILLNLGHIDYLNNSNTEENITFSENQTVYIDIPKVANITSAKLNLTGYISFPLDYFSMTDEDDTDGGSNTISDSYSLGRVAAYYPVDSYLLINTPPDRTINKLGFKVVGSNSPQDKGIIYNLYIAEAGGYLSGDPSDDNTTGYTEIIHEVNISNLWGATPSVYRNLTLDTPFTISSSKKYLLWFEFVNSTPNANGAYAFLTDDDGTSNNHLGSIWNTNKQSVDRLADIIIYAPVNQTTSEVWLEVGDIDGVYEWNQTGNFTITNRTNDFNISLQSYIDNNCTAELWENCTIPLTLHSDTLGKIQISAIDIQFTDYWWNTTNLNELTTYLINITPINSSANGISVISGNDFVIAHDNPNVTLNLPSNNYSNSSSSPVNIYFNCSATDDFGLANISLYITDNQNLWFSLNQSTIVSGDNSTGWTLSLVNGNYTWNCLAFDNGGNSDWGENRSITINYSAPITETPTGSRSSGGSSVIKKEAIDFDVKIIKIDSPIEPKQFFNFTYFVKGIGKINGDVLIEFWIEKNNLKITSGSDIIYFSENEEKTETTTLFIPSNILNNTYTFYVQASYKNYNARAYRTIEGIQTQVELKEESFAEFHSKKFAFWSNLWNKIKSAILKSFQYLKNNKMYLFFGLGSLILLFVLILIIIFIKKIKKEKTINRLKSTIKLKVYSAGGNQIGKIKEIYLNENRIYGWLIKVNKKIQKKLRKKQILIKHKNVESIGEIIIIDKKIEDFLNK